MPINIINGWITFGGRVLTGGHVNPTWWRGTIRPNDAVEFGPSITRFAQDDTAQGLLTSCPTLFEICSWAIR